MLALVRCTLFLLSCFHVLPLFFLAMSSALCVPLHVTSFFKFVLICVVCLFSSTSVVWLWGVGMAFPCISTNSAYLAWCSMQLIPLWLSGGVKGAISSPCAPYSFFSYEAGSLQVILQRIALHGFTSSTASISFYYGNIVFWLLHHYPVSIFS